MTAGDEKLKSSFQVDSWVWGKETIIWGYSPEHQYTFKAIEPKKGRAGCMSLQYHHHKSESWLMIRGKIWALMALEGHVATRIMSTGDVQNIPQGVIHRLMGVSDDAMLVEPSTPDAHAADKSITKDVVRLHCVHGREVVRPRNADEETLLHKCIHYTEEAIAAAEAGKLPPEHDPDFLKGRGFFKLF